MRRKKVFIISDSLRNQDEWKAPHSYGCSYAELPKCSGVYLFTVIDLSFRTEEKVLYVGKSINLRQRHVSHEIKSLICKDFPYPFFVSLWFKKMDRTLIDTEEINLIKSYNPSYNIIHRVRGVV